MPVEIEIKSKVIVARVSKPWSKASSVTKTTNTKNNGDNKISNVLKLLFGISSKNIFTTINPAEIDSTICISQIRSVGNLSSNKISNKFRIPFP